MGPTLLKPGSAINPYLYGQFLFELHNRVKFGNKVGLIKPGESVNNLVFTCFNSMPEHFKCITNKCYVVIDGAPTILLPEFATKSDLQKSLEAAYELEALAKSMAADAAAAEAAATSAKELRDQLEKDRQNT